MSASGHENNKMPPLSGRSAFHPDSGLWYGIIESPFLKYSSIFIIVISIAAGIVGGVITKGATASSPNVAPPKGSEHNRSVLMINGNSNQFGVAFKHEWHKKMLGDSESCVKCHHMDRPNDRNTACWTCHTNMTGDSQIFIHSEHMEKLGGNESCTECHEPGKPRWSNNAKACVECHKDDMRMAPAAGGEGHNPAAPGYIAAMHGMCVECHDKMATEKNRPMLGECSACHEREVYELPR